MKSPEKPEKPEKSTIPANRPYAKTEDSPEIDQNRMINMVKLPHPPKDLRSSGRDLWRSVMADLELDVHEKIQLIQACRIADRLDALAEEMVDQPQTVANRHGDQVPHPCVTEHRQQSAAYSRAIAALRLPQGLEDGQMVRPSRRGGARQPYGVRGVV